MKLRTRHLACLLLLLSSLSGSEMSGHPSGDYTLGRHSIAILLAQDHAAAGKVPGLERSQGSSERLLPATWLLFQHSISWGMYPPSAHAAALQATTGSAA